MEGLGGIAAGARSFASTERAGLKLVVEFDSSRAAGGLLHELALHPRGFRQAIFGCLAGITH